MKSVSKSISFFALVALLLPQVALAVGETTGRLKGTVIEAETQAPVPGANVTISGANLIGGSKTVQTSEEGSFDFFDLPGGTYNVEVAYAGVKPIKRKVAVQQGQTTPLNIEWSAELAQTEVVEVKVERHPTNPDSTQTGTVLSADQQGRIATNRSYQGIAQQTAGVVDVNGGGNPQIKGANYMMNRYMVDGLDITDPVTNTFSSNINFDSIDSTAVLTGGMEAQYNAMGGVINLVTKTGSDQWEIDSSFYLNHYKLSLGGAYGSNPYEGARPFADYRAPVNQSYQGNINIGGPIIKGRWWFHTSVQYNYNERSTFAAPPLALQGVPRQFNGLYLRFKTTAQPSDKHRISLSVSGDPASISNTQNTNYRLGAAQVHQNQGGFFSIAQWDYFASQNVSTQVQAGYQLNTIQSGPQGLLGSVGVLPDAVGKYSHDANYYNPERSAHINNEDNTTWYNTTSSGIDKRHTIQFDPSISIRGSALGEHDAKIGVQSRLVSMDSTSQIPTNQYYTDKGNGGLEAGLCDESTGLGCYQKTMLDPVGAFKTSQLGFSVGFFAQDRWKPIKRLTILPGFRADYGYSRNTLKNTVSSLFGFGPRIGATLDLTGDSKTIFTAFYGRSNEVLSLLSAAYADISARNTTYQWDQSALGWNKLNSSGGGADSFRLDPTGKTPHADEITLGLRRELFANTSGNIEYTYKRTSNIWDSVEINQIWDPTGRRVVGYANGKPEQISLYTRPDENWRAYHGIDFTLEGRPTPNLEFGIGYTLAFLFGPGSEVFSQINGASNSQFYNPRMSNFFGGFLEEDVRHNLKIRASYAWHGLTVGAFFNYLTGSPTTKLFFNTNDGDYSIRRSPQGTTPGTANNAQTISEFRTPDILNLDMRVQYDLHDLTKQHISLIVDAFNLLNLATATTLETTDVKNFNLAVSRQTPTRFQFALRYQY